MAPTFAGSGLADNMLSVCVVSILRILLVHMYAANDNMEGRLSRFRPLKMHAKERVQALESQP